ncbi:MAG TPA: Trp family transcriptional regulator [Patescibacteria group bacterium]|nr:Trp family transcriptional regulator [Patescibacteria group bacterium]
MRRRTYYPKIKREEKFSKEERLELMFDLINSFKTVRNAMDTADFLQDLLTAKEIQNLAIRLRIAKLLLKGETQIDIVKTLHTSFGTVAKVSNWLLKGGNGFRKIIAKLPAKYDFPKELPRIPIEFQLPQVLLTLVEHSIVKNQNMKLEKFFKGVEEKEAVNRKIREDLSEEFKSYQKR